MEVLPNSLSRGGLVGSDYGHQNGGSTKSLSRGGLVGSDYGCQKMEILPNSLSKGGLVGSDYGRQKWRLHDMRRVQVPQEEKSL